MAFKEAGILFLGLCIFSFVCCCPLESDQGDVFNTLYAESPVEDKISSGEADCSPRVKRTMLESEIEVLPVQIASRPHRCIGLLGSEHVAKTATNVENVGNHLTEVVSQISQRLAAALGEGSVGKPALPVTPPLTGAKLEPSPAVGEPKPEEEVAKSPDAEATGEPAPPDAGEEEVKDDKGTAT